MNWSDASVLVTGGTGSFGKMFTTIMLKEYHPRRLIIFSRDELKQHEMRCAGPDHECLRYFIGDVRDVDRLRRSLNDVDVVVHAAALKQVPTCEYNPIEAVMTNVMGARSISSSRDSSREREPCLESPRSPWLSTFHSDSAANPWVCSRWEPAALVRTQPECLTTSSVRATSGRCEPPS